MKPKITWPAGGSWTVSAPVKRSRGSRSADGESGGPELMPGLRSALEDEKLEIISESTAIVRQQRTRSAEPERMLVTTDAADSVVMLIQQEGGALIIRQAEPEAELRSRRSRRGGAKSAVVPHHFILPDLFAAEEESEEDVIRRSSRGFLSKVVRIVLVKVLGNIARKAAAILVAKWEQNTWAKKAAERPRGWLQVNFADNKMQVKPVKLTRAMLDAGDCLLLIHGTFSNATSCFGDLAKSTTFVDWAEKRYAGRIFAFNHFTMSQTPLKNVQEMLAGLPAGGKNVFDVITHSRGGLVLREAAFAGMANGTFTPRNVVLVAAPNAGTPLATSKRWDEVLTLFANLGELFPAIGDAVSWVASTLKWVAGLVGDEIPGLASMNMNGAQIRKLEDQKAPDAKSWHALVSNFHPGKTEAWWLRLVDAGIDRFFQSANDLVVPTEGGWIMHGSPKLIPAAHIGCYGPGGNLLPAQTGAVHHVNFFEQEKTVIFLTEALSGRVPVLESTLQPDQKLPARTARRSSGSVETSVPQPAGARTNADTSGGSGSAAAADAAPSTPALKPIELRPEMDPDTFSILILGGSREGAVTIETDEDIRPDDIDIPPKLLATFGTAHVLCDFRVRDSRVVRELRHQLKKAQVNTQSLKNACDEVQKQHLQGEDGLMGTRFQEVISTVHDIRSFTDGDSDDMPPPQKIRECGRLLFELLMRPEVRRLYDLARARRAGRPLYVNFTSQIPWVAGAPWELALDPHAGGSERLADDSPQTETSREKLRQGSGAHLATGEVIFSRNVLTPRPASAPRRQGKLRVLVVSAQPLGASRLSIQEESELMLRGFRDLESAGLAAIHALPQADPVALQQTLALHEFDVVHIISHGSFSEASQNGGLLFVDDMGSAQVLPERDLCLILGSRGVRLVFLNACESGIAGRKEFNSGLAAALVESGVPAVVANQFTVDDLSATLFSQHFYWYVAHGLTIGEAAREARVTLRWLTGMDSIDWAVPVLYTGDPHLRLCEKFSEAARLDARPLGASSSRARRSNSTSGKATLMNIAVWDVAYHFPALRGILREMNSAQSIFNFTAEDASMPVGLRVWNIGKRGTLRERNFEADQAKEKLKNLPSLLGADIVVCIIDQAISGGGWQGLYQYVIGDLPVSVNSTQQFRERLGLTGSQRERDQLTREKRFVSHTILNSIVWIKGGLEECLSGSKSCALYFDPSYDMAFLDRPTPLCDDCRKAFTFKPAPEKTQEVLSALDRIAHVGFD